MPVWRMAWTNVVRKLSLSITTLVAMAVAAAVLTSGMSLSKGTTKLAFDNFRTFFEADIVVFTPGFIGASPLRGTPDSIKRSHLLDSGFNPLLQLYPEIKTTGYLADAHSEYRPVSVAEAIEIGSLPGIAQVGEFKLIPARVNSQAANLRVTPAGYAPYLAKGRGPTAGGEMLEVAASAYGSLKLQVGDILQLAVPHFGLDASGIPYIDRTAPSTLYRAVVVGLIAWPSRVLHFPSETGVPTSEESFIHAPELYFTPADWQSIWDEHAGGEAYPKLSLRLKVSNVAELEVIARQLKAAYPQFAVFSVPELVEHGWRQGLLDRFYRAPAWMWSKESKAEPALAQEDFGLVTAVLLFVNAGMLLASQMLASVASRRTEIGILKAIGARKYEITAMVLVEAVLLGAIGASGGFLLMRFAAVHQSLTNGMPFLPLMLESIRELSVVLGLTITCALLFGLMPAWSVARLTVMEVFRRD